MSTMTAPARDRFDHPRRSAAATAPAWSPRPAAAPGPRPAQRPDHLRVVRPGERSRRLTPKAGMVLTGLLFATLFAVAGAQSLLVQGQVRLDTVDKELADAQAKYQSLRKDVAEMESPERIVAAAHAQGMVTPTDLVYLQPVETDPQSTGEPLASASSDHDWSSVKPLLGTPAP